MNRIPVQSSNIASVGYDQDTKTLEIEFRPTKNKGSRVYIYFDVPYFIYSDLVNSAGFTSAGRYFREAVVKGGYRYEEIKGNDDEPIAA